MARDGRTHPQAQSPDHLLWVALQDHPAEQRGAGTIPPGPLQHGCTTGPRASVSLPAQGLGRPDEGSRKSCHDGSKPGCPGPPWHPNMVPLGTPTWSRGRGQPLPSTREGNATPCPCSPQCLSPSVPPQRELTPCPRSHPPPGRSPPCCPAASASLPPSCQRETSWSPPGVKGAGTWSPAIPEQRWPRVPPPRGVEGQGVSPTPGPTTPRPASVSPPEAQGSGGASPGVSPQEVAEGVEEAGEHGRQHQLWETGGASAGLWGGPRGRGGSPGLPPTPFTSFSWQPPTT